MKATATQLIDALHIATTEISTGPSFNIAPTDPANIVVPGADGERVLSVAKFGFLPTFAGPAGSSWSKRRLTNARSETVRDKPAFRRIYANSRALVPCTGFYEWRTEGGVKQPHFIAFEDDRIFAIAAVISNQDSSGSVDTGGFALLTTEPNDIVAAIHNRMPVILPPSAFDIWLDVHTPLDDLRSLLVPADSMGMRSYPIDRRVGNPRVDDPRLIKPIDTSAGPGSEPTQRAKPEKLSAQLSLF